MLFRSSHHQVGAQRRRRQQAQVRQEWRAGTDPTNALSVLRLLTPTPLGSDLVVTWETVPGRSYCLEWSTNLGGTPRFVPLATNIATQGGMTAYTHSNGAAPSRDFYRVGVE